MSLKQFLAVGHSFVGIRSDKSPFAMRPENQLPIFAPSPRFIPKEKQTPEFVQGELLSPREAEEPLGAPEPRQVQAVPVFKISAIEAQSPAGVAGLKKSETAPPVPGGNGKGRRRWYYYLTFGLLGRPRRGALIQSELSLEQVRVLRNDLADADLELVIKKKRASKPQGQPPHPAQPDPGIRPIRSPEAPPRPSSSWNELTARLFEIGQQ